MNTAHMIDNQPPKIQSHHLERSAIVYVRQSHPQQAQRHRESAEVQASLKQVAIRWGWPAARVLVLDGDQGKTATTTEGRGDFAWLLSEISMEHVGLLLGFQFNRLTREDEAWCRLIKVCSLFDTLLADTDGLYHPHDFNDRLLLAVKGLVGGLELHQIQQRMQSGRLNKARRGEWMGHVPLGYIVGADGKLQLDPDEHVQAVVRLMFGQFEKLGSLSALLRYLARHNVQLPIRSHHHESKGELQWRRPHRETVRNLLRRPAYTGTYTWGRRRIDPRRAVPGRPGTGRKEVEPRKCEIFLPNNHAAYISWEQYDANIQRLTSNRQHGPQPGPARETVSLLAGRVVCGQCGSRMQTTYSGTLRYCCQRQAFDHGTKTCQSLIGEPLEQLITQQVLRAVEPASLQLSIAAVEQSKRDRAKLDGVWQLRLQRAQQEVDRAFRQYNAVEPENRLVARTLERTWEETLLMLQTLKEEYDRFRQTHPLTLSVEECEYLKSLARDLPSLWNSPKTLLADKRHIVRLLLKEMVVWAPSHSDQVGVECHWADQSVTHHTVTRTVRRWEQLGRHDELMARLATLVASRWTSPRIAEQLNAEGFHAPRGTAITAANVRQLISRRASSKTSRLPTTPRQTRVRRQSPTPVVTSACTGATREPQ